MLNVSTFPIQSLFWKAKLITETIKWHLFGGTMENFVPTCRCSWIDYVMTADTYNKTTICSVKQLLGYN